MNYVQQDISSEISVDAYGFGTITLKGLCMMLCVSPKPPYLDTVLSELGFAFHDLDDGIPDLLVPYILDVYATTEVSERAKVLRSTFCTLGVRAWFKAVKENPDDAIRSINHVMLLHTHFNSKLTSK